MSELLASPRTTAESAHQHTSDAQLRSAFHACAEIVRHSWCTDMAREKQRRERAVRSKQSRSGLCFAHPAPNAANNQSAQRRRSRRTQRVMKGIMPHDLTKLQLGFVLLHYGDILRRRPHRRSATTTSI